METTKKVIRKSIRINASKEKLWEVLFTEPYTRIWYEEFSKGSYAETDWRLGSKAIFKDDSHSGLIGKVVANQPNSLLSVEYTGVLEGGKEDYESDIAKQVQGGRETYVISESEGSTLLEIEGDMAPEYFDIMSDAWDRALEKVKVLSEKSI